MASASVRANDKALRSRRGSETMLVQHTRPRSLIGQIMAVLLQPGSFFNGLTASRQWLWVALLILALTGASAVRQVSLIAAAANPDAGGQVVVDPSMGGPGPGGIDSGVPPDAGVPGAAPAPSDVNGTWTTALVAAGTIALGWVIQMILLCEVSLFRGRAPSLGQNLRIAVWASLPLALMAGLQLAYYAAGGSVGQTGLIGYVEHIPAYAEQSPFVRGLILSALSRATVFWLWSALLLYIGARYALGGNWLTSSLVVLMWAALLIVAPVVTGAITASEVTPVEQSIDSPADQPDWSALQSGSEDVNEGKPDQGTMSEGSEAQPAPPSRPVGKG
jgi:hypothetical protein